MNDAPLPEPFPRANHVALLRQATERRRKRIALGAATLVAAIALGGGTAAYASIPQPERETANAVALATGDTASDAKKTLGQAESLLDRAEGKVDTEALEGFIASLASYEELPEPIVLERTADAGAEIDAVTVAITDYEEEQDRIAAKKKAEAAAAAEAEAEALAAANTVEGAKATAASLAADTYGWGSDQFSCLDSLWTKESGWNYQASNASSGAYGIPQSLPGSKMSTVAADWQTNATTQITWGLDYIARAYGTPCSAWAHSQAVNWY
ncbi:hypothetical protein [Microbacterium sp. ZXX196]|uniref:aggregation-promoting factor C-terminal-like domain-containing protein n=1 Tax=Microbacterium sp. ZXX196 TaxID=2609291 RepID=UPI0012B7F708|nr:hypothetical protein [Microbacterium sp. ZXX196]MTE23020.1 hypothetical protein [Microbacterium sp. ZXX196]